MKYSSYVVDVLFNIYIIGVLHEHLLFYKLVHLLLSRPLHLLFYQITYYKSIFICKLFVCTGGLLHLYYATLKQGIGNSLCIALTCMSIILALIVSSSHTPSRINLSKTSYENPILSSSLNPHRPSLGVL